MILLLISLSAFGYYSNDLDKPQNDSDEQVIQWEDFYFTCKICDPEVLILTDEQEEDESLSDSISF